MFRRGGSTGGITSGLRQGYKNAKRVLPDDLRSKQIKDIISGETTIGEAQDLSRALSYRQRGTNVYDFMSGMGINLLSQPAHGNIWQQAARASKEPYERMGFFGQGLTGLMGGYPSQYQFASQPQQSPLTTALGIGTTLGGIYGNVYGTKT